MRFRAEARVTYKGGGVKLKIPSAWVFYQLCGDPIPMVSDTRNTFAGIKRSAVCTKRALSVVTNKFYMKQKKKKKKHGEGEG